MGVIKKIELELVDLFKKLGYEIDNVKLVKSSRPDLGDYQINDCMILGKKYGVNPREIAEKIVLELNNNDKFKNINIAGPGFINVSFSDKFLIDVANNMYKDIYYNIEKLDKETIFIDYGGANLAKTLHVGHIRSANIGEGLKRLCRLLGKDVIADVHFGDIGRQSGMIIYELRERYPNLNYFSDSVPSCYDELPITGKDLEEIYPIASNKAKEDPKILEEVQSITKDLENGNPNYVALWNKIKDISKEDIIKIYRDLYTDFDLWEGESDSFPYIEDTMKVLNNSGLLYESEGALVIDVIEESDNAPMPPLVVIKSNGATLYATRELATIYSRVKRFDPDKIWYVVDNRQSLYFEQVFRASHKTNLVKNNLDFELLSFGTMNGVDGKPFKTRDGGNMSLKELIRQVNEITYSRLKDNIPLELKDEISRIIAIAALKYADLSSYRTTDYIFDMSKFCELEGKTGPYLLYSTIRINSLLCKAKDNNLTYDSITKLMNDSDRSIIVELLNLSNVLINSYNTRSLNEICDYLYKLTNTYNKFYSENKILIEEDNELKSSWLVLSELVYNVNKLLLDTLAIKIPKMM